MGKITHSIHHLGPLIGCSLTVHSEFANALRKGEKPVPARVHGLVGLIDTGSDAVLIDSSFIAKLSLPVHSATKANTVDGQSQRYRSKCELGLILVLEDGNLLWEGPAYCDDFLKRDCEFDLIIGRCVLEALNLHYDGPNNEFTVSHEL